MEDHNAIQDVKSQKSQMVCRNRRIPTTSSIVCRKNQNQRNHKVVGSVVNERPGKEAKKIGDERERVSPELLCAKYSTISIASDRSSERDRVLAISDTVINAPVDFVPRVLAYGVDLQSHI